MVAKEFIMIFIWLEFFYLLFVVNCKQEILVDMFTEISVPKTSFIGHRANLTCNFNLTGIGLYSLKWYHNDVEFYRNIPTETDKPVLIKSDLKFNVHEIFRSDEKVILQLSSLTSDATGEYKCEVIAEHPSFRTEAKAANMTVIEEPPQPPTIEGARKSYERGDMVKLRCIPRMTNSMKMSYDIAFYIAGKPAHHDFVYPLNREPGPFPIEGVGLKALAEQLGPSGSTIHVECHQKFGDLYTRTSNAVEIKITKSNNFASFWSEGTRLQPNLGLKELTVIVSLVYLSSLL